MENYIIYLRKSRQDDPNETVEEVLKKHESRLQEYALTHFGYRIPEKNIMRELASGETIADRPVMTKLLKMLETGTVTGVLAMNVSRLSRGDLLDAGRIVQAFLYTNTLFITPMATYDLKDKRDKDYFEMELTRGSYYLEFTKEVLHLGRVASVKNNGSYLGSYAPYGYEKMKIGKVPSLKPHPVEAPYLKMIFKMYGEDKLGCTTIANKLNSLGAVTRNGGLFNENTVRQMLDNEVYIGKVRYGYKKTTKVLVDGEVVKKRNRDYSRGYLIADGKHEPLVSQELWEKVQERRGQNPKGNSHKELQNPLAGLLKCAKCKTAITQTIYRNKSGESYRKTRYTCRNHYNCDNVSSNTDAVIEGVIEGLKTYLEDFELRINLTAEKELKNSEDLVTSIRKQIAETKKKQNDICDFLEKGIYTVEMFIARKEKLLDDMNRLEAALVEAEKISPKIEKDRVIITSLHKAIDMLKDDSISAKLKNDFLKTFIEVIWYEKRGNNRNDGKSEMDLDIVLK
jgi:hypothetical protein